MKIFVVLSITVIVSFGATGAIPHRKKGHGLFGYAPAYSHFIDKIPYKFLRYAIRKLTKHDDHHHNHGGVLSDIIYHTLGIGHHHHKDHHKIHKEVVYKPIFVPHHHNELLGHDFHHGFDNFHQFYHHPSYANFFSNYEPVHTEFASHFEHPNHFEHYGHFNSLDDYHFK